MTPSDLVTLLPVFILALTIVGVLLTLTCHRNHRITATLTVIGLALAGLAVLPAPASPHVMKLLVMDGIARFFMGLIIAATAAVALLAVGYLPRLDEPPEEFYLLLLLATLGSCVLVASTHFVSFFLGLELLSVSLYALIAYPRGQKGSLEAGFKYLVLAATSAAFLLFGLALIYAEAGSMEFAHLSTSPTLMVLAGVGLVIVGVGFKLALVPFHWWTPDVYEGAPAPVTAYVATVSKGAIFALLLRFFSQAPLENSRALVVVFWIIAIGSMVAGNLLALLQNNVKRILAYSSIAHLGYLLVAFLANGELRLTAVAYYFVAYFVTMLGAFGVVTVLTGPAGEPGMIADYRGLFWRRPWLAGIFTAMLLSLAGIPLTAGFVGKFLLVAAGVGAGLWPLLATLVITSVIGLFYYLRIVVVLYETPEQPAAATPPLSKIGLAVLAALTLLLVGLGVYPTPLVTLIQAVMVN